MNLPTVLPIGVRVRTQRYTVPSVLVLILAAAAAAGCHAFRKPGTAVRFQGAPSVESLLDEFVAALAARDEAKMHSLRVTEAEYRDVIIPGSATVGQQLQGPVSDKKFQYFWGMLNTKSRDVGVVIMHDFGGRPWQRARHWFTQPPRQFSGYEALGEVRIAVTDGSGTTGTVRTGWIANVDGRYKFVGFEYDDD